MNVWTVANQKGGVGKTTTSIALAGLAAQQGKRVLLVDLDPHGSLSSYLRQDPDRAERGALFLFTERDKISRDFVLQHIVHSEHQGIDLVPAATALATLERKSVGQEGLGLVIKRALHELEADYDLVIIDTPPLLGVLMVNALAACDELVIPVQTEFLALKGLERMVNTLKMMSRSNRQTLRYHIVPTMFDRRTHASVSTFRTIRHDYPEHTWPGRIPVDTKFRDASKMGVPPSWLTRDSQGVEAYQSLYKWLLRQGVKPQARSVGGMS